MAYMFVHNERVHHPGPDLAVPGSNYVNLREYFKRRDLVIVSPEDYPSFNIYPVHFTPEPAHHPFFEWTYYALDYDPVNERVNQVWTVETLQNEADLEERRSKWLLPGHRVHWILQRNGWDSWTDGVVAELKFQHDLLLRDNTAPAILETYPNFAHFTHQQRISLAEMIAWVEAGLTIADAAGIADNYPPSKTPTVSELISTWNAAWLKESATK